MLLLFAALAARPAVAEQLPVKDFANLPMLTSPTVSPDGKHIATKVLNSDGYYDIAVAKFGSSKLAVIAKLPNAIDRIDNLVWAND